MRDSMEESSPCESNLYTTCEFKGEQYCTVQYRTSLPSLYNLSHSSLIYIFCIYLIDMTQPVPAPVPAHVPGLELLRLACEIVVKDHSPATAPPDPQNNKNNKKKKRGRKPTPGMSEEERKRARLLKNRRTAELSRRRKNLYIQSLTAQRDSAIDECENLRADNRRLRSFIQSICPHNDSGCDFTSCCHHVSFFVPQIHPLFVSSSPTLFIADRSNDALVVGILLERFSISPYSYRCRCTTRSCFRMLSISHR